uniref:R3H domain containing 1 n=1 Tax=Periophthalmus magnuspinnatus TaxID=409849 RepID=A0A3B3ZC62_9GOBI
MRSTAVCEESPPVEETFLRFFSESSAEYTDCTGIDLHQFIVDTLNNNPRERMILLELEQDMINFITSNSPFKRFPPMSSFHRMLVHRVAAYFGMEHNVDQTGKCVIINKTSSTRIPEHRFLDEVQEDKRDETHRWKVILKRDSSLDDQPRLHPLRERQSKSMEEREEEYQRVRDRIFNQLPNVNSEVNVGRIKMIMVIFHVLHRGSRDNSGSSWTGSSGQSSFDTDCRYSSDPRPWSSTDSDSSYQWSSPTTKPRQTANSSWDTHGAFFVNLDQNITDRLLNTPFLTCVFSSGQPFLNPDGTRAVYNPPDSQQPIRSQAQLQGSAPQQQVPLHKLIPTPPLYVLNCINLNCLSMLCLHVFLLASYCVLTCFIHTQIKDLSSKFAHVAVSCQSNTEAPSMYPPTQGYVYAAPPPPSLPNPPNYCQPSPQVHTHPLFKYRQYKKGHSHFES